MNFVAKPTKKGYSSQAYNKVSGAVSATHIKLKDENKFVEITKDLIIKQKRDESGNPTDKIVHYADINNKANSKEEYVCVIDDKEVAIDNDFYAQIVFMTKNADGVGNYYKTEPRKGLNAELYVPRYIHKEEIQIPAYQKLALPDEHDEDEHNLILDKRNNGNHYAYRNYVRLNTGEKILLPSEFVTFKDGKYYYENNGYVEECVPKKEKVDVAHVLLDGDKIVDISKITQDKEGNYLLTDGDETINVGQYEMNLGRAFIEGSTISSVEEIVLDNSQQLTQTPLLDLGNADLKFIYEDGASGPDGLLRVEVNKNRNVVKFVYKNREVVYAEYDVKLNLGPNAEEHRVKKFEIENLADGGIKFAFYQKKNAIAEEVEFDEADAVTSCVINDRNITDIEWLEVYGNNQIISYTIDGVPISNIEWHAGTIKSCDISLKDEDGFSYMVHVDDLGNSQYRDLAITCKPINKIDDFKVEKDGKVSFKLGDYRITNAEYDAEKGILVNGIVKKNGEVEREVDFTTDKYFKQLSLAVKVVLDKERVAPLIRSKLLERTKDGEYKLIADVVQTKDFNKDGMASASIVETPEDGLKHEQEFKKAPFATVVIDEKGKVHNLTDFKTSYNGESTFEQDNEYLKELLGKTKLEVDKGKIVIDSKDDDKLIERTLTLGFALCTNPITLIFGLGALAVAGVTAVALPTVRGVKKLRVQRHHDLDKVTNKLQVNAEKECVKSVNNLVEDYQRKLKYFEQECSSAEFREKQRELRDEFVKKYYATIGNLQMIGGGTLESKFSLGKKTKLSQDNFLAYLACFNKSDELRFGKNDHPDMDKILKNFNETQFDDENSRTLEQVRLYQKYGGAFYQRQAHATKMQNIDLFLSQENAKRLKSGQETIKKEDYIKQLKREYNAERQKWGGVSDKLEAFMESEKYLVANKKERAKLLKDKKKELENEWKNAEVKKVELHERLDKNGEPLIKGYVQDLELYLEKEVLGMFTTSGNHKIKKQFKFGYKASLSKEELKYTTPAETLEGAIAKKVNTTVTRRVEFDNNVNNKVLALAEAKVKEMSLANEKLNDSVKDATKIKDYESAFIMSTALDVKRDEFEKDCNEVKRIIDATPYKELSAKKSKSLMDKVEGDEGLKVSYDAKQKKAKFVKNVFKNDYTSKVKSWALKDFAEAHKAQFATYEEKFTTLSHGLVKDEALMYAPFFYEMSKDKEKAESYANELETYKVKHHIEDNVSAEVFCEVNHEDFEKFIADRNAQSKTGELDPNSEIARCYYYAYCKKGNGLRIENFNKLFAKKIKEKAKERLNNKTLTKHDAKQDKKRIINKDAKAEKVDTNVNENETTKVEQAGVVA